VQPFQVTKVIEFAYGHRLLEHNGKCRYLHGHNGVLEVDIAADALDSMGMVIDFGDINEVVKTWVDKNLDHRMLLCRADPLAQPLIDAGEPIVILEENPTAENIARLIWNAARDAGLRVGEVRLWETSNSRAAYRGERAE
jgi:6-pyruvoyltetrahydropterin/6-carboxytetrahydropterin synthase